MINIIDKNKLMNRIEDIHDISDWYIKEYFSIFEASILSYGFNPILFEVNCNKICSNILVGIAVSKNDFFTKEFEKFESFLSNFDKALKNINSIKMGLLEGVRYKKICFLPKYKNFDDSEININNVDIHKNDIREYLNSKNISSEFFNSSNLAPYLDPNNPHYSDKLATAIKLWEIFNKDPALFHDKGKTVGKRMTKWLSLPENADKINYKKKYRNSENMRGHIVAIAKWTDQED